MNDRAEPHGIKIGQVFDRLRKRACEAEQTFKLFGSEDARLDMLAFDAAERIIFELIVDDHPALKRARRRPGVSA